MLKTCKGCGSKFSTTGRYHIWCSDKCRIRKRKLMKAKTCAKCAASFTPLNGRQRFCSVECGMTPREGAAKVVRTACAHCGGAMTTTTGKQLYCGGRCRKAAFVARHAGDEDTRLDVDGDIPVKDLEDAPRRLRVAKLFDLFEGAGNFDHFPPVEWMRPQDKRASR